MKNPEQFWSGLEAVAGLRAVTARWRQALGADAEWARRRRWLRPTGDLATCYPKLETDPVSPRLYRVVLHDPDADDIVGVCPDRTGRIDLRRQDVLVYEFDLRAFAGEVARALEVVPDFERDDQLPGTVRLGSYSPAAGEEAQAYLTIAVDGDQLWEAVAGLSARQPTPFLLLTPTKDLWRTWPPTLRRDRRSGVYALSELVFVGAGEALFSRLSAADLLRGIAAAGQPLPRADGFYAPGLVVWSGREHACDLSPQEGLFFRHTVGQELTEVTTLMYKGDGAVWHDRYRRTKSKRDVIAQMVHRMNEKLAAAEPRVPLSYSLVRGQDYVRREVLSRGAADGSSHPAR